MLKNEGYVPATVKFEPVTHQDLTFVGPTTATINPKQYQSFEIGLRASTLESIKYQLDFTTLHNPYEQHKVIITGQGF